MKKWKTIPFASNYEVSKDGVVRRLTTRTSAKKGHILSMTKHAFGYPRIKLTIDGKHKTFELHFVVATCFLGERPTPKHQVAHLDGDPSNNNYKNLSWVLCIENQHHKEKHGTMIKGEKIPWHKLTEENVRYIRKSNRSCRELSEELSVSNETIRSARVGLTWKHIKRRR